MSSIEKKRMQQSKILSFFKPANPKSQIPTQNSDQIDTWQLAGDANPEPMVTYNRRSLDSDQKRNDLEDDISSKEADGRRDRSGNGSPKSSSVSKILNKKRSYAQYHLELGQSDFLLHACSVCGLMYARGDEADEKVHKAFHKDYYEGIQFKGWRNERVVSTPGSNKDRILLVFNDDPPAQKQKGWRNERVVSTPGSNKDRILLVFNDDPPAQKQKVNQVTRMMEKELGFSEDSLIHELCKVYLFISSNRVVGCLVAEPIKTAHRVISSPSSCSSSDKRCSDGLSLKLDVADNNSKRLKPTTLKFGQFNFQREVAERGSTLNTNRENEWDAGALLCEEETLPAICGFRAVFVAPSKRRKRIASELLNAARESFFEGKMLEISECAFSPPTSSGKALASSYSRSESFLIYRKDDV